MSEVVVVLALASPLLRARLRGALEGSGEIRVAGETDKGGEAARLAQQGGAAIVLCDRHLIYQPELAALAQHAKAPVRLVLVTMRSETAAPREDWIAGTLPVDLPPPDLGARLRSFLVTQPAAKPLLSRVAPAPDLHQRFTFGAPVQQATTIPQAPIDPPYAPPPPAPPAPRPGMGFSIAEPVWQAPAAAMVPAVPAVPAMPEVTPAPEATPAPEEVPAGILRPVRRKRDSRQDSLAAGLQSIQRDRQQHPRDPVTGLVGRSALFESLALLPRVGQSAAFIYIEVWHPPAADLSPDGEGTLLRRMAAAVRANVRQDDLICSTAPTTFTLLLPDLTREATQALARRLYAALTGAYRLPKDRSTTPTILIGVSFWKPGMPAEATLAQAVHSVASSRPSPTGSGQTGSLLRSVFDRTKQV